MCRDHCYLRLFAILPSSQGFETGPLGTLIEFSAPKTKTGQPLRLTRCVYKGQVLQRYYGHYASRVRGKRRKAAESEEMRIVIMPNRDHGLNDPYVIRRRWDYFVRHLLGVEPPKEFRIVRPEN